MKKANWRIKYHNKAYTIKQYGKIHIVSIGFDSIVERQTTNKYLQKLVGMWFDSEFDILPGRFIAEVSGHNCVDIIDR